MLASAGRAARRMAAVGVAVAQEEVGVGLERVAHPRADDHPAERQVARRHALGEGDQVRA